MKIEKEETYEEMIARQKAERKAMRKKLAEEKKKAKAKEADKLLAVLHIFYDGKTDMEIANIHVQALQQQNDVAKLQAVTEAYNAIDKK